MSDVKKVAQITDYKVSVTHHFDNFNLVLDTPFFSEINNYYSNTKRTGVPVKKHHTLNSLLERLNTIKQKLSKNNSIAILKGLYKGGTIGANCYESAPFLFFDIDVKESENSHLLDAYNNAEVFEKLQAVAVLVWRSNSGNGMAGILYVPQLSNINHTDTKKHLVIGKAVCNYLKKEIGINAEFDPAQSKFRQVRFLAQQKTKCRINLNPYVFKYEVTEVPKISQTGVKQYRYNDNRAVWGSIADQFNRNVPIHTALLDNGFTHLGGTRYKHFRTTSTSSGSVKGDVFLNASTSFSRHKVFTSFYLYLTQEYDNDLNRFIKDLKRKGYKTIKPTKQTFKQAENNLKNITRDRQKQIFEACFNLQNASYKDKIKFVKENAANKKETIWFYDYLKIKSLNIPFDKTIEIQSYVSEQLSAVLDYADKHKKTILTAETGTGKTTAFLKDFETYRPNKRLLILAPLTAIVEQTKAEFKNVIALTGNSTPDDHINARRAPLVIATYEQGYKHLTNPNTFDLVVIDEVHNLITAHSYKRDAIKKLTSLLNSYNVIGLTGTPNLLFKAIGYKMVRVQKQSQDRTNIKFITDNRPPLKIALQHLQNVKGKCIMRVNSRSVARDLKAELVKAKSYKKAEILILNSDAHVKKGKDFEALTNTSQFNEKTKLVLTTSIIDEGLSIKQKGFTDVVFIETSYKPMPEALKQFFARFRNEDHNRKNYFYYKETKNQTLISWNPFKDYNNTKTELVKEAQVFDVNDTDKKDIMNTKYLYYENGTVNEYALAYDVSTYFFKLMTKQEYIHFIENNYNIQILKDNTHAKQSLNTSHSKKQARIIKKEVANSWINQKDEVMSALYRLASSLSLKKTIDYTGQNPPDEIFDLVSNNLKTFEDLHKNSLKLENLGIQDVDAILIDLKEMKPYPNSKVNRAVKLYQNLDSIKNPKSKIEIKNSGKLLSFVNDVLKIKNFNRSDVFRCWNKQKCNSIKPSYYNLIDLVQHYEKTG